MKRYKEVLIRVTPDEKRVMSIKAKDMSLSLSALCRLAVYACTMEQISAQKDVMEALEHD